MKIQELMTTPVTTIGRTDTLAHAAQLMWDHDCGILPVVDGDGHLVGVVTDRDVCMSAWSHGRAPDAIRVEDAMARQVFSIAPDADLEAAEKLMAERRIHRVPVVDREDRPIGMLSMNDLAREVARPTTRIKGHVARVLSTIAAISTPPTRVASERSES